MACFHIVISSIKRNVSASMFCSEVESRKHVKSVITSSCEQNRGIYYNP